MRKILAAAAVVLATMVAVPVHAGGYVATDESHVQNMVNQTRASKGLGRLTRHADLVEMARAQADKMAAKGNIFHNLRLAEEIIERGLEWGKAGENVGMGPDVDLIENAFLKSPHHYENIIDPMYNAVGIGVVDGSDGRRYVAQVFANIKTAAPKPAPQPATAPAVAPAKPPTPAPAVPADPAPASPAIRKTPPAPKAPSPNPNAVIGGVVHPLDLHG